MVQGGCLICSSHVCIPEEMTKKANLSSVCILSRTFPEGLQQFWYLCFIGLS
ncbi:unnamed protein product [Gulo gulo]|uniref:Uncharacterized protein n=1 Tax=Gulo gulo TaxID=48420 RepID=A0A9X9PUT1_GULGU|nr:unnamed protein product [Gulo gulo]